ncbi:MAG: MBL fold metallo-hydrolase [Bacteroidales bacterium]|jgi:glyoxylase-like metal-dependent hydrolase (beta-lactamase superfamily II)|nr:MBL fold metallo-hydrolase [Bacteroidales bacterium]
MIQLKQFVFNPLRVNTWLLYDEDSNGILIDAAFSAHGEQMKLDTFLKDQQINLTYLLNTHGHFDHVMGTAAVKRIYNPQFLIHQDEMKLLETAVSQAAFFGLELSGEVPEPDAYLEHGQWLQAGEIRIQVLAVPGHSPGGVAFWVPQKRWLFTGDTLFAGGIGRTDLPGGSYERLMVSIREQLLVLDPETEVFPGHGPISTIGTEIMSNPFIIN